MSACSDASHSRMSAGTIVTVPSHPSAMHRFCRVTTALGFFSTAYTLRWLLRGGLKVGREWSQVSMMGGWLVRQFASNQESKGAAAAARA